MDLQSIALTVSANVTRISAEIAALQETAKIARQEALQPFLKALAASGEVSLVVVRGYTPSFNDGEPCEHSADFWVNLEQMYDDELLEYGDCGLSLDSELIEGLEASSVWDRSLKKHISNPDAVAKNTALCAKHGHIWSTPSPEMLNAIKELIFKTAEENNGTNYYISYTLIDGEFVMKSGSYDCGH